MPKMSIEKFGMVKYYLSKGSEVERIAKLADILPQTVEDIKLVDSPEELNKLQLERMRQVNPKFNNKGAFNENEITELLNKIFTEVYGFHREIGGMISTIVENERMITKCLTNFSQRKLTCTVDKTEETRQREKDSLQTLKLINNKLGEVMFSLGIKENDRH